MPFWRKETEHEKLTRQIQEAAVKALESGQLPAIARHRLENQAKLGDSFFTSDLTSREYLLSREAGYKTLSQVMGSAFVSISLFGMFNSGRRTGELTSVTQAHLYARQMAVQRMQMEAEVLGATGVISVELTMRNYDWSSQLVEFTALGTAIQVPGRPAGEEPFTSNLSGQEFWQLHQAGYWPRGLAFGICSYYIYTDPQTRKTMYNWWGGNNLANREITLYTQGFYEARERAMGRLVNDIRLHKAEGAVGMSIDQRLEDVEYEVNDVTYHDVLVHFAALGTAVEKDRLPTRSPRQSPLLIYDLASGKTSELVVQEE